METRLDAIKGLIRSAGGRVTATRLAIAETMIDSAEHMTADELVTEVRRRFPTINRSTVYRTLGFLEEAGIVDHVHLGHGRAVYHLADRGHQHLVCESCAAVTEIPIEELRPLEVQLENDHKFALNTRHFAIVGTCERCRRAKR
ncbi:MAG: transcriptional repressor [Acidobacteria bacterium]|nr:MAG: transcriptional repressor [Acidobacteriota bacterium]